MMLVYVIDKNGSPLMPCTSAKARMLFKEKIAKCIRRTPFTIKLLYDSSSYKQEVIAGMDTGSTIIGSAAISNRKEIYKSEIIIRDDVSKKMSQRKMYRINRRKKLRYRQPRWNNRVNSRRKGRLPSSIKSKIDSHLREKNFIESILPVTKWILERASFDIHKITNPNVSGIDYQNGPQKGFLNTKAYVLHRDGYKCQSGQKIIHSHKLVTHRKIQKKDDGTDTQENLVTLCVTCHNDVCSGILVLKKGRKSITKYATEMGIIKSQLGKRNWKFEDTFGYLSKMKREEFGWSKSHVNDAVAICCNDDEPVLLSSVIYKKRHVAKGDYAQTHNRKIIPTGKLFGLRKFDLIKTKKGIGFIKAKRSSGQFVIMNIDKKFLYSITVNKNEIVTRLSARSTTLIYKD